MCIFLMFLEIKKRSRPEKKKRKRYMLMYLSSPKNKKCFYFKFSSFLHFSVPDEITVLKNLERLDLANNEISG